MSEQDLGGLDEEAGGSARLRYTLFSGRGDGSGECVDVLSGGRNAGDRGPGPPSRLWEREGGRASRGQHWTSLLSPEGLVPGLPNCWKGRCCRQELRPPLCSWLTPLLNAQSLLSGLPGDPGPHCSLVQLGLARHETATITAGKPQEAGDGASSTPRPPLGPHRSPASSRVSAQEDQQALSSLHIRAGQAPREVTEHEWAP